MLHPKNYRNTGAAGKFRQRRVHGGDWQTIVETYGYRPDEVLDFSANINPLGPPGGVIQAIRENTGAICRYPDPECRRLKKVIAAHLDLDRDCIITANGAVELIYLFCQVLKPRRVMVINPTFGEYYWAAKVAGAKVVSLGFEAGKDFALEYETWARELDGIDLVFVCNPNNPTGQLVPPQVLNEMIATCRRRGIYLFIDESFIDFIPEWWNKSAVGRAVEVNNLFVLRSMTKIYAIPGLRLGYGIACRDLIDLLNANRPPWNTGLLAQEAGIAALNDGEYLRNTWKLVREEKEFLYQGLKKIAGLRPLYPEVNFILTEILSSDLTSTGLAAKLVKEKIIIRDCSSFKGLKPNYFRLAVKTREDNEKILAALNRAVGET